MMQTWSAITFEKHCLKYMYWLMVSWRFTFFYSKWLEIFYRLIKDIWIFSFWVESLESFFKKKLLILYLRNLYAAQEATVRTGHGTTDWFQIGKGVHEGCILSPCLFNLYAEYIMRNTRLEEAQAGIKIVGELSITSDMQMTPPLWQKAKKN